MLGPRSRNRLPRRPLGRYRYVRLRWRVLFAVIDLVGTLVFGGSRRCCALIVRLLTGKRPPGRQCADPQTILLVQLDHLGDAVISTAMLPLLRRRYPHASIEVLAGPWTRALFEALPEIDRVHVSRVNRFARTGRLAWMLATLWWGFRLRRLKVDLAIDVRGEFPLALMLWLSGARRRVGWDCGGGGFLLTDSPRFVPDRPEVDSRLALLAELGIRPDAASRTYWPVFRPPEWARRTIAQRLDRLAWHDLLERPRLVVHVGAGMAAKQWPAEHWRELLGRLIVGLGARVVLVGDDRDRTIAQAILGPRAWPGVVDWTGQLGLVELGALLEQADLAVGADSGPAHLAAAVETPVVVLFSGTNNPRQWQPSGRHVRVVRHPVQCSPCHRRRCPWHDHACMKGLAPEQVAAVVERLLEEAGCCRAQPAMPPTVADRPEPGRAPQTASVAASQADEGTLP